ncbi:hypothetical protein CBS101457_001091 [Exobasidium rhododendri]|nr:hypothetical protein CBS101457_001091 [Exobasidium rhododendri]
MPGSASGLAKALEAKQEKARKKAASREAAAARRVSRAASKSGGGGGGPVASEAGPSKATSGGDGGANESTRGSGEVDEELGESEEVEKAMSQEVPKESRVESEAAGSESGGDEASAQGSSQIPLDQLRRKGKMPVIDVDEDSDGSDDDGDESDGDSDSDNYHGNDDDDDDDDDNDDDEDDDADDDSRSEAKGKGKASGSVTSYTTAATGFRGGFVAGDFDQSKLPEYVPATYACYTCVDKGKVCMVFKNNPARPCVPCDKNKSGRARCNADQIFKDGNGVRGKLEADIRRAVYAFKNKGKKRKGGKYLDWVPTRVNVDLRAANPYWKRMINKELADRVEAFKDQSVAMSEAARLLERRPKDFESMIGWRREVRVMAAMYGRDLARLNCAADMVEGDLEDQGYELEVLDLGPKQKKKKS